MDSTKYDFQPRTIDEAVEFLTRAKTGESLLFKSPTGSGKSFVIGGVKKRLDLIGVCYVVAPSHEIVRGLYEKHHGTVPADTSKAAERRLFEAAGYWTVKRLHNAMADGTVPMPDWFIFDESHHSVDTTHATLWAFSGFKPRIGVTATDYRGTPAETMKLREAWPVRRTVLTIREACDRGVIARPDFITWPLLNDHTIDIANGEFVVRQVDNAVKDRMDDLVSRLAGFYDGSYYDRATMVTFSSVAQCRMALHEFRRAGLPAVAVTGTRDSDFESNRARAFRRVVEREVLLIQIAVVGEGVDLPIRRLVDVAPTMSPMRWMQRVGRATRPFLIGVELPPEIINCCHNFTRHSYLWAGALPPAMVRDNLKAWGEDFKPNRRDMARAIGLEGFGRFTVTPIPLADGTTGSLYTLQTKDGLRHYAVFLHPLVAEPYFFTREFHYTGETATFEKGGRTIEYREKDFSSKWKRVDALPELTECVSIKNDRVTQPMLDWWRRGGRSLGLDSTVTPDKRQFQILPILANTRVNLCQAFESDR